MIELLLSQDWRITLEKIQEWLQAYENLGPLPGILAPMIESFVPILPLVAILVANAAAYGLWLGFLYSWLGVCIGSFIVFQCSRQFGGRFTTYIHRRFPKSRKFFNWIESHGFTPLFVLSCFPFTPSFFVNVISGLTGIPRHVFMTAVFSGKAVMIFLVSLAGYDITSIIHEPVKLLWIGILFTLLWFAGRWWQTQYDLK